MSEGPQSDGPLSGPLGSAGLRAARRFLPAQNGLNGTITVPGDKSVSHRAILFGAVNDGPLRVSGFLHSADTMATLAAARALGVEVDEDGGDLLVHAGGWEGLREPADVIDVRNAGTLIRLLPGLVAPLPFLCVLTGDLSIRRRPMARILQPLAAMGAKVAGRHNDTLPPIAIRGGALRGMRHELAVASAQVKSCIMLAGLRAQGVTEIVEPAASRDHTERIIRYAGGRVEREGTPGGPGTVRVWPVEKLHMDSLVVPGLQLRRLLRRGRAADPGVAGECGQRRAEPDPHGASRHPRAHGRQHHGRGGPGDRPRADRVYHGRHVTPRRYRCGRR